MQPRISVILPTVGRETLKAAVDSCAGFDEVIIEQNQDGDHGYAARHRAMARATGTHLAFLDDDDVFEPWAYDTMRMYADDVPVIFQMDDPTHGVIWRDKELRLANVGTPMFLVPNGPDKLGVWEPYEHGRCGDYAFIKGCVEKFGDVIWKPYVVCRVRPHERGPTIAVVTPWHNHMELLPDYKYALDVGRPDQVFVVDNASDPKFPLDSEWFKMTIPFHENVGFTRACNAGLNAASTDAVLFLNNDIKMISTDWLKQIRAALEPGVLVGAKLRFDAHSDASGYPLPYLDGWCLAGMREDLLEIGGLDESLEEPAYYSDNLLCLEARAAGMTLREAKVGLLHKLNGSTDPTDIRTQRATVANQQIYRNRAIELMATAA